MTAYQFSQPWLSKLNSQEASTAMEFAHLRKYLQGLDDGTIQFFNLNALNATIGNLTVTGSTSGFPFLPLAGGTMSGNIAMGGNKVTGLGAATTAGDATRYEQLALFWFYRKPVLQYSSGTVVVMERGGQGTASAVTLMFSDGQSRTDSSGGRLDCDLTQTANFSSGTNNSGIRTGSVAANTWYYIYAVKGSNSANAIVAVADTVLPLIANIATLNSNFGTNSWLPIGLIRYGDNSGTTGAIIPFTMAGNMTLFSNNVTTAAGIGVPGTILATSAGTVSLTYTYSAGTGTTNIPANIAGAYYSVVAAAGGTAGIAITEAAGNPKFYQTSESAVNRTVLSAWAPASSGVQLLGVASTAKDISLAGFTDTILGVGSNPLL